MENGKKEGDGRNTKNKGRKTSKNIEIKLM